MDTAKKRGPRGLLRKTLDFLSIFKRSRRGALGISILVFFTTFAFVGPLLAPYDPVRQVVSARTNPPTWYSYFEPGLSQNIAVVPDPDFNNAASVGAWKTNTSSIVLSYAGDVGVPGPNPGSLRLTYTRDSSSAPAGNITARVWVDFHYPFPGPALGIKGSFALRATGVSTQNIVSVKPFLEETDRSAFYFAKQPVVFTSNSAPDDWKGPLIAIDSGKREFETDVLGFSPTPGIVVAEKLFRKQADFRYGIEVQLKDVSTGARDVQVFLDNFFLQLYGSSWGLLGTQWLGYDLFAQLSFGARVSLLVGVSAAVLSIVIGLFAGLMAGYLGKFADELIMRFTDMLLVLPGLPLLLVVIAVLGPNIWNIILLISLLGWMGFARTVRSQVLSLKERPYIEASRAVGAGTFHITLRHVFPNIIGLTYVSLALAVPGAIISEAALSWLGLGDPLLPSWGKILYEWQLSGAPSFALWWVVPPGICIAAVSLSFVLIGYALDEVLNPKLRQRR